MKLFWAPWAPTPWANIKLARFHIRLLGKVGKDRVSWTFLPVALASDSRFRLSLHVPYLVNTQRVTTVCDVGQLPFTVWDVTHGKGYM